MNALTEQAREPRLAVCEIVAEIWGKHRDKIHELWIDVVEGGVIIHGHAHSFHGKQVAQHEVLNRTNLVLLANKMTVWERPAASPA